MPLGQSTGVTLSGLQEVKMMIPDTIEAKRILIPFFLQCIKFHAAFNYPEKNRLFHDP